MGVIYLYNVIFVLRSQLFEYLRETLYEHALLIEHLEAACSEKKVSHFFRLR